MSLVRRIEDLEHDRDIQGKENQILSERIKRLEDIIWGEGPGPEDPSVPLPPIDFGMGAQRNA